MKRENKYEVINRILPSGFILRVYRHSRILGKLMLYIREKYILYVLKRDYGDILKKYQNSECGERIEQDSPVWFFWGQGEEHMPALVEKCYKSLQEKFANRKVVLVTLENYLQFINIEPYIMDKLTDKHITITAFSDILRFELLSKWGGVWCDATVLVHKYWNENIENHCFYTLKHKPCKLQIELEPSRAYWRVFFMMAGKNNVLVNCCAELYRMYFKNNDTIVDYFLVDYFVRLCYENIPAVKTMIDEVEEIEPRIYELFDSFNAEYAEEKMDELLKCNPIQKLNWRGEFSLLTEDGRETFYAHLLNE